MLNVEDRLAKLVRPYLERAQRREGVQSLPALADRMGCSVDLLRRAGAGRGPSHRVLDLCDRGAINPAERAEVVYLLTGVWPIGGGL